MPEVLRETTSNGRWQRGSVWALVLIALALRAPGLNRPLLGNFATKNVAYAMIARNWVAGHAPVTLPKLDVLRGGERGLHLLEVPISAYLAGLLWSFLGGSLDFWGRAVSVACSTGAVLLLYVFACRWFGHRAGLAAGWFLAISPVAIIFGQSFMLEASVVLLSLVALDAADRFGRTRRVGWCILSGVALSLLVLTKIYMLVLLLPLAWLVWLGGDGGLANTWPRWRSRAALLGIGLLCWGIACLPAIAWCIHVLRISQVGSPLAEHVFYSLRNSQQAHQWPPALLGQPDFYCQLLDDAATILLTPIGFTLLLLGLCRREAWILVPWLAAMAVLVLALPAKFHAMNYYLFVILPPLAILAGLGWKCVSDRVSGKSAALLLAMVTLAFSLRYSVKPAFVTPDEDRSVLAAAAACRQHVPRDEPVATVHGTTFDLLYYCDRRGWVARMPSAQLRQDLEKMHREGANYLVVAHLQSIPVESQQVLKQLPVVVQGDDFALFRLPPNSGFAEGPD